MRFSVPLFLLLLLLPVAVFAQAEHAAEAPAAKENPPVMLFNITSSPEEDVHAVTMALQLAGHALDDGREVVLFFNVRGAITATTRLPKDLAFHATPVSELIANLAKRGAELHVCPHCMKAMAIEPGDLIEGAVVTDREKLFSKIGSNTVVFSY